jgi:hypothetical protein
MVTAVLAFSNNALAGRRSCRVGRRHSTSRIFNAGSFRTTLLKNSKGELVGSSTVLPDLVMNRVVSVFTIYSMI